MAIQDRRTAYVLHHKNCTEEAPLSAKLFCYFSDCARNAVIVQFARTYMLSVPPVGLLGQVLC